MIPEEIRDKIPVIDGKLVVDVLEALFGQQLLGKTIIQIMEDWLDISLSMSEDCLNLNVAKPAVRKQSSRSVVILGLLLKRNLFQTADENSNLPVLFFIYGGAFVSGFQLRSGPERLGDVEDVVIVTTNYRVGSFGEMTIFSIIST